MFQECRDIARYTQFETGLHGSQILSLDIVLTALFLCLRMLVNKPPKNPPPPQPFHTTLDHFVGKLWVPFSLP